LRSSAAPPTTSKISGKIPASLVENFSGENALDHIKELETFGPRPPQSEGYRKSLLYLEKTLKELGWDTTRQEFTRATPIGPVEFTNLLARYGSEHDWKDSVPFAIGSHLDTKRMPSIRFMGSNDSGSSTGVLVELARVLATDPAGASQVELVFFDGEEALLRKLDGIKDGLYGSKYYANELNKRNSKPQNAFVLDLVGDPKVPLLVGLDSAKELKRLTAEAVVALGLTKNVQLAKTPILDDHFPLINKANIPTLHLIGNFQAMPYWHKAGDTIDKLSPLALQNTGKLTLKVLSLLTESLNGE